MLSRTRARTLLACTILPLTFACKGQGSAEQDSRPLPAPEPPASAATTTLRDDLAAKKRPSENDAKEAPKAKRPSEDTDVKAPSGSSPSTGAGGSGGGASAAGGAPTAQGGAPTAPAIPSTVPGLSAPSAACLSRCQTAMQGCLSAPVDGGVPGFGNLELCKKAFEACQSACSKQ